MTEEKKIALPMRILSVIKLILLPGLVLRAFNQHLICRVISSPVESRRYLRSGEGMGQIKHEPINSRFRAFMFSWVPCVAAEMLAFPMLFLGALNLFYLDVRFFDIYAGQTNFMFVVYLLIYCVGVSLWCCRFPTVQDSDGLWSLIYGNSKTNAFVKVLLFILTLRIRIMSRVEKYGINLLIAAAVTALLYFLI